MKKIPDLGFWKLWNISFGFFGVQIAYALQSANISRIFSTLGADPHSLSYFWILPPLAGIIVQPIIGALSDRTWTRFGRRIPYLFATVALNVFDTPVITTMTNGVSRVVLDTQSAQYQTAGDWVGILFAVQAIGSVIWATIIPMIQNRKLAYVLSLVLGGIGFISIFFIHNQYALFASFILIGCAWAAMLALPFTILTNALTGGHMGTYLGLFNGTICVPQIVAASLGGIVLKMFTSPGSVAPEVNMLVLAGVFLIIGAGCVSIIKER